MRASISKCAYGDAARQQASGTQGREARTGREGRTGRKERNGRQVGENDEDWRTGSKERTGGSSYLPTITCRACCSAGTACSPSTSVATSLSCMRHIYPRDLHGRSIDVSMAGWIRDGTDDGRWPNRRRTTPPCRGRMPAVPSCPLPPSGARRPSTYLRQLQLHDLAACAMQRPGAPCLPSSNQPDTSAPAPSANAQLSEPRTGWVTLPRGFGRFFQTHYPKNPNPDSAPARREGSIDTP